MHVALIAILQSSAVYVMKLATSTTGTDYLYYNKASLVDSSKTTVLEFMVKVETSGLSYGQVVQIANGTKLMEVNLKTGSIIFNSLGTSPYTHTIDMTATYHVINLEFQGTTQVVCKVDGTTVATVPYVNLNTNALNRIFWGDGVGTANCGGTVYWETFKYNLDYAGSPTSFAEWNPATLPTTQSWTAGGTESLATIIVA